MSDDELFENWWQVYSPPGTFDKAQCKIAFLAGLASMKQEIAFMNAARKRNALLDEIEDLTAQVWLYEKP